MQVGNLNMKRWLVLLSIPLLILDCSNKKKGLLLLPFLGLGDGSSTETKAAAANTGDGTFTVVGLETTDPTQITTPTETTGGSSGDQTSTTPGTEVTAPTAPVASTPAPTTVNNETTVVVVDQTNDGNFNFEQTLLFL